MLSVRLSFATTLLTLGAAAAPAVAHPVDESAPDGGVPEAGAAPDADAPAPLQLRPPPPTAPPTPPPVAPPPPPETVVKARRPISAASSFSVRDRDFELRPIASVQDILRVTPGLVLV